LTPFNRLLMTVLRRQREDQPETGAGGGERRTLPQDHGQHAAFAGSDRHSDADLARPLTHLNTR
jgi:hypothetical protein